MALTPRIILVGGGVRSGKSAFAQRRAEALGIRRTFVATAQALDDEMRARIDAHKVERAGAFETVETPFEVARAIERADGAEVVLVDCLTLFVSNLLCADHSDEAIHARFDELVTVLRTSPRPVVLVTNEVGLGIVPDNALSRRFRDLTGLLHRRIAEISDELYFATMGVVLRLRPSPVEVVSP